MALSIDGPWPWLQVYFFPRRFLPESICLHFAQIQANKYFFSHPRNQRMYVWPPEGNTAEKKKYFPSSSSLPFPKFRAEAAGEKKGQAEKKKNKGKWGSFLFFTTFLFCYTATSLGSFLFLLCICVESLCAIFGGRIAGCPPPKKKVTDLGVPPPKKIHDKFPLFIK